MRWLILFVNLDVHIYFIWTSGSPFVPINPFLLSEFTMTEKATHPKESKLATSILDLADKITATMTNGTDTGMSKSGDDVIYETAPSSCTREIVASWEGHKSDYIAAGTYAAGRNNISMMAANLKLESASTVVPLVGKDQFTVTSSREDSGVTNGNAWSHKGSAEIKFEIHSMKNQGIMKKVRDELKEYGSTQL